MLSIISNLTLTRILKELEYAGVLLKEHESNDKWMYKLSKIGLELLPGLVTLQTWGVMYQQRAIARRTI